MTLRSVKSINYLFAVVSGLCGLLVYIYFIKTCGGHGCTQELMSGTLKPLIWGGFGISAISVFLIFFPEQIFKLWLKWIFSWGILVSVFIIWDIDINSSGIFAIGRGEAAVMLSYFFGGLTVLFVAGHYFLSWFRGRH